MDHSAACSHRALSVGPQSKTCRCWVTRTVCQGVVVNCHASRVMEALPVYRPRDLDGLPTASVSTTLDSIFAQGYLHARDQLFQMELQRLAGSGARSVRKWFGWLQRSAGECSGGRALLRAHQHRATWRVYAPFRTPLMCGGAVDGM